MTTINVEKLVQRLKQTLRNYIFEIPNFENWWDNFNAQYDRQTQTITFSPIPFIKLQLKLCKIKENEVQFKYTNSPFKGTGTWFFNECNDSQTIVSFTISITGKNFIMDSLIKSSIFKRKHKRDILKLLNKLDRI